jgi:hypothetical protein
MYFFVGRFLWDFAFDAFAGIGRPSRSVSPTKTFAVLIKGKISMLFAGRRGMADPTMVGTQNL